MDVEEAIQRDLGPHDILMPGALGTGKKKVPLYLGDSNDPNRRIIGEVEVDLDTGEMEGTIDE